MSFVYPLGLLGLLAIPVLILIYILKNKHTEQVISSTYLWRLSERFLKRRNPISKLTGIISLILQILAVTFISFGIARPVFTLPNAAKDYVFVLDASGSMQYEKSGKTRFARGVDKIEGVIEDSKKGSTYTLIVASDASGVVFDKIEEKDQAITLLEDVEYSAVSVGMVEGALDLAKKRFEENPSSIVYLITDKEYEGLENVKLINLSDQSENYAVSDLTYHFSVSQSKLVIEGKACSYESDKELDVEVQVCAPNGQITRQNQPVVVSKLEETDFSFEVDDTDFDWIKVRICNDDGLPADNESVLYRNASVDEANRKVLIVSNSDNGGDLYLRTAMSILVGESSVEQVTVKEYSEKDVNAYSLIVYESWTPTYLPQSSAVWFVNPGEDMSLPDAGFSVRGSSGASSVPIKLKYSTATSTQIQQLLKNVIQLDNTVSAVSVGEYSECSLTRNFHKILLSGNDPVLFAGTNEYDNRQVVFAFDFQKSNFAVSLNYMTIMQNLYNYTFPKIVEESSYVCGEPMLINVLSNCESIRVDTPDGKIAYLDPRSGGVEYTFTQVGTYEITQTIRNAAQEAKVKVYANLPKEERVSISNMENEEKVFSIEGTPEKDYRDGKYDDLIILFIILAVIFVADWVVYCYEQYQLR